MELNGLELFLRILEAGGPTTVAGIFLFLFIRGDIVSIKTVREIVDGLATEISARIVSAIQAEISDLKDDMRRGKIIEW